MFVCCHLINEFLFLIFYFIIINFLFFFNDTATTEIYTLFPTRRSSDLDDPDKADLVRDALIEIDCVAKRDRKSTRLNSSHSQISYAVFCLKKKKTHPSSFPSFHSHKNEEDHDVPQTKI